MCLEIFLVRLFLKSFFVFSQGILLVKHQSIQAPAGMVRLWMHEMSRVFGDRLADPPHRVMFEHMLIEAVGRSVFVPALGVFFLHVYFQYRADGPRVSMKIIVVVLFCKECKKAGAAYYLSLGTASLFVP